MSKNNKINDLCKEIKYMDAYSGGQYDQMANHEFCGKHVSKQHLTLHLKKDCNSSRPMKIAKMMNLNEH